MFNKDSFLSRHLYIILLILFLVDLGFFSFQYYHQALDGDIARIVLPSESYSKVLQDPFGISVIVDDTSYPGTNRFFIHWSMTEYFQHMPNFLQNFVSPLESVYFSAAIAKSLMHIFLLLMLAMYISGRTSLRSREFMIAVILTTPLFHNWGSGMYLGFIDYSVTYAFFYAFPMGLLMLFFLPYFLEGFHGRTKVFKPWVILLLMLLAVVLAFSGALVAPVILLVCPVLLLVRWWPLWREVHGSSSLRNIFRPFMHIPWHYTLVFFFLILLCLYSFLIGMNNSENVFSPLSLSERYSKLPLGLWYLLTGKTGVPLLLLMLLINTVIIARMKSFGEDSKRLLRLLIWIGIFSLVYIFLLPLGGYRVYRPYIIREDTVMPVLLALVTWYGLSTLFLLNTFRKHAKTIYLLWVIAFLIIFISNDPAHFGPYKFERAALEKLVDSDEKIVELDAKCPVMAWGLISNYKATEVNCRMLLKWNVLKEEKWYYQVENNE